MAGRLTKQATTLPAGGNISRTGKTAQDLHREMMGGNHTLNSTVVGGNGMGGAVGTGEERDVGQQQCAGRESTGWSALTEAVKMFGTAETTLEFSKKLLIWQAYVGGELTNCATFNIQAVEAENLRVFVGMVKGDTELKIFHSMLKYNDFFVAQNLSKNVIAFMGTVHWKGGRGYSR